MKPIDVIPSTYFVSSKEINYQNSEFKIGDVKISTYENVFEKGYLPNRSKEVFVIKKLKTLFRGYNIISDLKGGSIFGIFNKKELEKNKLQRV